MAAARLALTAAAGLAALSSATSLPVALAALAATDGAASGPTLPAMDRAEGAGVATLFLLPTRSPARGGGHVRGVQYWVAGHVTRIDTMALAQS